MKKALLLARVLRVVGNGSDNRKTASLAARRTGSVIFSVVLIALSFFIGFIIPPVLLQALGGPVIVFQSIFLLTGMGLLFYSVLDLINSLYMSTDLPLLISMPLTQTQIVFARMYNSYRSKLVIAASFLTPFGIGYALNPGLIAAGFTIGKGMSAAGYWIGLVLADICIPIVSLSIAGILVILIMSVFHFIRNKDVLAFVGAVLSILIAIGISSVSNLARTGNGVSMEKLGSVLSAFSRYSVAMPILPFLSTVMAGVAPWWHLLLVILITLGFVAVLMLVAHCLYLRSALAMQTASSRRRILSNDKLSRACRKRGAVRSYTLRELRIIFRTPAFMSNGWLMTFLWPVFLLIPFLLNGSDGKSIFSMFQMDQTHPATYMGVILGISLLAVQSVTCLSCLGPTCVNREGKSFFYMKMLPVSYSDQIRAKRNVVMLVGSIGSIGYLLIAGIVMIVLQKLTVVWLILGLLFAAALLYLMSNIVTKMGLKKLNLNWEDEATMAKVRGSSAIIWVIGLVVCILLPIGVTFITAITTATSGSEPPELLLQGILLALAVLVFLIGLLTSRALCRKAEKVLSEA